MCFYAFMLGVFLYSNEIAFEIARMVDHTEILNRTPLILSRVREFSADIFFCLRRTQCIAKSRRKLM